MRLLVTGAGGMLGQAVTRSAQDREWEVISLDRAALDVSDSHAVASKVAQAQPEAVVHCAAFTHVDRAEMEEARAFAVNALGAGHVAHAAAVAGARMLHVSSDYVLDGQSRVPHPTDSVPFPVGAYGRTKLAGEWAVQAVGHDWLVVRTSWLYGAGGPNFVDTMDRLARTHPRLRVVNDQWGRPTWTGSLAPTLLDLLEHEARGIYHVCDGGEATWFELAQAVVRARGLDTPVDPVTTEEYGAPAPRPRYSVLDVSAAEALLGRAFPHWKGTLDRYLEIHSSPEESL